LIRTLVSFGLCFLVAVGGMATCSQQHEARFASKRAASRVTAGASIAWCVAMLILPFTLRHQFALYHKDQGTALVVGSLCLGLVQSAVLERCFACAASLAAAIGVVLCAVYTLLTTADDGARALLLLERMLLLTTLPLTVGVGAAVCDVHNVCDAVRRALETPRGSLARVPPLPCPPTWEGAPPPASPPNHDDVGGDAPAASLDLPPGGGLGPPPHVPPPIAFGVPLGGLAPPPGVPLLQSLAPAPAQRLRPHAMPAAWGSQQHQQQQACSCACCHQQQQQQQLQQAQQQQQQAMPSWWNGPHAFALVMSDEVASQAARRNLPVVGAVPLPPAPWRQTPSQLAPRPPQPQVNHPLPPGAAPRVATMPNMSMTTSHLHVSTGSAGSLNQLDSAAAASRLASWTMDTDASAWLQPTPSTVNAPNPPSSTPSYQDVQRLAATHESLVRELQQGVVWQGSRPDDMPPHDQMADAGSADDPGGELSRQRVLSLAQLQGLIDPCTGHAITHFTAAGVPQGAAGPSSGNASEMNQNVAAMVAVTQAPGPPPVPAALPGPSAGPSAYVATQAAAPVAFNMAPSSSDAAHLIPRNNTLASALCAGSQHVSASAMEADLTDFLDLSSAELSQLFEDHGQHGGAPRPGPSQR
jgi:hypothetical protein